MREIKFRAWDSDVKEMFYHGKSMPDLWITFGGEVYHLGEFEGERVERLTLMQYTGLKDKNGVEIYEGDVLVLNKDEFYEVLWVDAGFALKCDDGTILHGALEDESDKYNEIAGNIYEYPDLVAQQAE